MSAVNTIALVINALTITLALFMLILLLWQDQRSLENLFFGALMGTTVMWSIGALLARVSAYSGGADSLVQWGLRLLELGFTASCAALYLFTAVLSGERARTILRLTGIALVIVLVYQGWQAFTIASPAYEVHPDGTLRYAFSNVAAFLYGSLVFSSLIVVSQRRRKFKDNGLVSGILLFSAGTLIELISPDLRSKSLGLDLSATATLAISFALVRAQVIGPLRGRANQLKAVRDVGVTITSSVRLEEVLGAIAGQAASILQANGAAIFLNQGGILGLAAVHNMPGAFRGFRLAIGEGFAGQVAATQQSARIDDYRKEWLGKPDMPFAKESFGAVVAAPLIFADEVMGVLMVIEGPQGKRFDREDTRLLDLLGPQAAVAITNSRLFERQNALTDELASANNRLETVLTSTENPVIALNRRFRVIFANPAASQLLNCGDMSGRSVMDVAPVSVFPADYRHILRTLRKARVYTYELTLNERTYLCHLGLLGFPKRQGYVALLNDVTQLKEIDRMKNQMIHMTSHDLKNPLAAAMFHVELLQEEGQGLLTPEMVNDVNTIWIQLVRMNRVMNEILDLTRVQSGKLVVEDCAIDQLIRAAVQELGAQAARGHIDLRVDLPANMPVIAGNQHHLSHAINNVIENAVKFTQEGGHVSVRAEVLDDEIAIHVTDTGIGIALDDQPHIFEQFFRGSHPGAEHISGTGLGLSLVKAVIDAHHGRVWMESEVGNGTVVHIVLPLRQATLAETR